MTLIRTDIAIIGQGLAGSLLAWELWKRGADFRIIDPGNGRSASAAAGGLYYPLAARKLKQVEHLDEQLPRMKNAFREMEKYLGQRFLFEVDSLKLVPDEDLPEWENAQKGHLSGLIKGINRNINLPGLQAGYSGVIIGKSGYVDLPGFISSVRNWLAGLQLLIQEKAVYDTISFHGDRIRINRIAEANRMVFCEGTAAVYNPHTRPVEIRKNKGELIEIIAPELQEQFILKGEVFVLPLGNGHFRVGATYSHNHPDDEPTAEGLAELTSKLGKIMDVPYRITSHRAGFRPTTYDRQPVIGPLSGNPQMTVLNGFGSRGVLQAPWYAAKLATWLTAGEADWPNQADAQRFQKNQSMVLK